MKKLLFKTTLVIVVSILFVLTANAQTNSTLQNQVSVYPVNPTAKDSVYFAFSYVSNDGCPDYYLVIDSVGKNNIYVNKKKIESNRVCTQVISNFTAKINIGTIVKNTGIYFEGKLIKTIIPQCIMDKSGIVVKGANACEGQLFIQEYSPLAVVQLYRFENKAVNNTDNTLSGLKVGDKVKFGGNIIKNDSIARLCNIVGFATCWEKVINVVPCEMDRKGEVTGVTANSSILKDINTQELFQISNIKLVIGTILQFKGVKVECKTTPCYNIVECYKIINIPPPPPCVMDKKGVVIAGKDIFAGQLFIQEISPISSYIPIYAIQYNNTSTRLKIGDEVKFGGYLQRNDSAASAIYPLKLVGVATCWELITDPGSCIMDRKGEITRLTENSSIVKDISTGEIFEINRVKLAIGTIITFKGNLIECITTPCYNIVECYKIISVPPVPCNLDKTGVVVEGIDGCTGQLFIEEFSPAAIALKQLYIFKNNSVSPDGSVLPVLKPGDKVKFGGYSIRNDSNNVRLCNIIGVATCWKEIRDSVTCVKDRKGVITALTENASLLKDISTGEIFAIKGVKLAVGTTILFKGVKIVCITTPCYNVVECYQIISNPPAPCVMDKRGVVVEGTDACSGKLFIQVHSPISAYKILFAIQGIETSNSIHLKVGDEVKFGGYSVKNDSTLNYPCQIIGVATCWEVISDTATCVKDRKGVIKEQSNNASIVKDISTGEIFAINGVKLAVGTTILFKGVKIVCITTPCYNVVECYQIISSPPAPCVMDKIGVVVPGIDGCTGRLFIKEITESNTYGHLYEIQNYIATSSDGNTISKLQAGDKVRFGVFSTKNDSTKSILCYTAGIATCWELIASENAYTLAGKVMAGKEIMKSGIAVLFRKGEGKAIASNTITDGTFTFTNVPEAAYTVYVIPDISIYKNYLPTFYINKFLFGQADYIRLYQDIKEVVVYLRNIDMPIGTGRIYGNIFFETEQLKDSILAAKGSLSAITSTNRNAENATVVLFDNTNQPVSWTVTDVSGNYSFENLVLSTYRVVSETASAKAEKTVNLSTESSEANANLILRSAEEKTGLNQIEELVLNFYPNPVTDRLIINVKENVEMNIYSAVGQLVQNKYLYSGVNILDVSAMNKGIYLAKIGNTTVRLVKK